MIAVVGVQRVEYLDVWPFLASIGLANVTRSRWRDGKAWVPGKSSVHPEIG